MKIVKAIYQATIPTGQYMNERPGLEAELEEGEDPVDVIRKLKALCNKSVVPFQIDLDALPKSELNDSSLQTIYKHSADDPIIDIQRCETMEELATFKLAANSDPKLREAYMSRLKELQP